MDIRIFSDTIDLFECENMNKEELEFILMLLNKGGYWELRDNGDSYTLHDKGNYKYKGRLEEIKNELSIESRKS